MSAWRTRFDTARNNQTQTNQGKHDRKRTARKTTNHLPLPSQHRDKLKNLKLRVVVRPRTRTRTLLAPPLRFLQALRRSRPSTLGWCRFALLSASATHALQMRFVSWSSNMLPQLPWSRPRHPACDRRGHEGLAAFCLVDGTVHRSHTAWCASALRRALRVCSSTRTLVSVLRLSAVSLSVCV